MPASYKISVVIPTYNRRDLLARTLASVACQDFPSEHFEIVVVVDGSTDGSADLVRSQMTTCPLTLIEQKNRGRAAARNVGMHAGRGDLILFLDDDVRCTPTLLRRHWNAQLEARGCVNIGAVRPDPLLNCTFAGILEARREIAFLEERKSRRTVLKWPDDTFVGLNCSVPRELLAKSGGFDEELSCREDSELGFRIWKEGVAFRFDPGAIVYHMGARSSRDYAKGGVKQFTVGEISLCRMHPGYRRFSPLAAWFCGGRPQRFGRRLARRAGSLARMLSYLCETAEPFANRKLVGPSGSLLLRLWTNINATKYASEAAGSWNALELMFGQRVSVLAYHRIGVPEPGANPELTISPEKFERQMAWLARHCYHTILPSEWIAWIDNAAPLPEKPIILTFDDAYAGTGEAILPILSRFGFRGVVFAPSALIGRQSRWDAPHGWKPLMLANVDELVALANAGFEIGSHTRTHEDLISSFCLSEQVSGSADELERIVGQSPSSFCYPYGHVSSATVASARERYRAAFTCKEGRNDLKTDPILLRRTTVMPTDTMLDFRLRAGFGTSPVGNIVGWSRRKLRNFRRKLVRSISHEEDSRAEHAAASRVSSAE